MPLKNNEPIIFLISGKARNGKNSVANLIKENITKSSINLEISSYIKEYAKKVSDWDGGSQNKPRELLQQIGTEIIRKKIDENLFIRRIIEDIQVFSYYFDVITISDIRFKKEIEAIKNKFSNVILIHVIRSNFDSELTEKEQSHITEIDLDNYHDFDYEILNNGTLEELNEKVIGILNQISNKNGI